ncbi:hypothetical protein DPMN_112505 [Dreissena polymorpha]|uniref:Uncharacterized protein n=1 Tax=Dreissena polymorpha TaxID=45954 RepID=A0A9D4QQ28_DREPO|nr:hypothetical protein DPMN_112505 [Dreissena polymorpha]
MGVDITQYRIRIGGFTQPCARAPRRCNNEHYNPCTQGTDVHFRTFVCLLFVLGLYAYAQSFLIAKNHAINLMDRNAQTHLPINFIYCTTDVHVSGGPVVYACLYQGFHQRILSLVSDVELNPGPTNGASHGDNTNRPLSPSSFYTGPYMNPDTQYIVNTMAAYNKQTNDSIAVIGAEIQAVRHDMQWVKQELNDMNCKINNIEARQHSMGKHIQSVETKFDDIDIEHQKLRTEFEEVAHMLDRDSSDLCDITKRLENLEGAEIRNSFRIFGLQDDENETSDKTKLKFASDIYNVAYPNDSLQGDALIDIKRVGKFSPNTPRMVLAKFKTFDIKAALFKIRDQLRVKGIRISSELTQFQRTKVRELHQRGINAYFKNGVLYQRQESVENRVTLQARRKVQNRSDTTNNRQPTEPS